MNLHSACRVLLSGATLLAATAMATPSPCLAPRQPADKDQQQPARQHAPWRNPCHLVDAQKPESEQKNDGEDKPKDVRQRLDEIEMFTHLNAPPEGEQQLQWMPPGERGQGDALQWHTQGGPGSWSREINPMYRAGLPRDTLHTDGISAEGGIPAVPEPANVAMLLGGLAVLAGVAARKRLR
jgi:hypothetical protein